MFEVGEHYELVNGAVGECIEILGDSGIRFPVTLYFEQERWYLSYTLDGCYFDSKRPHALDVVGRFKRKLDIETFGKKVAKRIMEIIAEEIDRHKSSEVGK